MFILNDTLPKLTMRNTFDCDILLDDRIRNPEYLQFHISK